MGQWVPIAKTDEVATGTSKECVVEGRIVALFSTEDGYYAIDGICAHAGGPIAEGALNGCVVTCPWHGWQYEITTGEHCLNPQIRLQTFPVKVEGDSVLVEIS
ncbi:Rieske (2Fe-2S) protein [Thalassoglobus sp. JC818]|uniref:Rieske (2Fe-2S) protein n=1 Tax=Thalassoglobus sp. JC818 TaxID=3232136 RepID=UPI0034588D35